MPKSRQFIIGGIISLHLLAFGFAYFNSYRQRTTSPKVVTKFQEGDCLHHKDMNEVEFYVFGVEQERYKIGLFQGQQPAYTVKTSPVYSLTNYMDKFYVKTICPDDVEFKKTPQIEKDPLYSIRVLIMSRDLKIK